MLETLRDDVRRVLREARIGYTGLGVRGNSVEVRIREAAQIERGAQAKLQTLRSRSAAFSARPANATSTSPSSRTTWSASR